MLDGNMIEMTSRDGVTIDVYEVKPQGPSKGGLVLIQEIFGLNDDMKRASDRFADAGYHVLAPSMFDRLEKGFASMDHSAAGIQKAAGLARENGLQNAMNDIGACLDHLRDDGPVFVTGFCYGGSMAWLAACQIEGFSAASAYYGSLLASTKDQTPKCPVIAHYGKHDPHIPVADGEAFAKAHPETPVYFYDAGHGFAREGSSDHDPESDALAFNRTIEHFEASSGT